MSTLGKRVWQKCHRGFESHPVRHSYPYYELAERDTTQFASGHLVHEVLRIE